MMTENSLSFLMLMSEEEMSTPSFSQEKLMGESDEPAKHIADVWSPIGTRVGKENSLIFGKSIRIVKQ